MFAWGVTVAPHPYYLSVTELKYNAGENSIEGSVKVFVHDLEKALKQLGHKQVDLIHPKDRQATEAILRDYIKARLKMWVNGSEKPFTLLGFEQENEHFWMHVMAENCPAPKKVTFENSILYDFLKEQINIVHFDFMGKSQSAKVVNPEKEIHFILTGK